MGEGFWNRELGYYEFRDYAERDQPLHGVDCFRLRRLERGQDNLPDAKLWPLLHHWNHPRLAVAEVTGRYDWGIILAEELTYQRTMLHQAMPQTDVDRYLFMCRAIIEAVQFLHEPDPATGRDFAVVHGNIHLNNCGFFRQPGADWDRRRGTLAGRIKLGDFRTLRISNPAHPRRLVADKLVNRPPEAFDPRPIATPAVDVWALGCLMFALWIGNYPFVGWSEFRRWRQSANPAYRRRIERTVYRRALRGWEALPGPSIAQFPAEIWHLLEQIFVPAEDRLTARELAAQFDRLFPEALSLIDEDHLFRCSSDIVEPTPEMLLAHAQAMLRDMDWGIVADLLRFRRSFEASVRRYRRQLGRPAARAT